MTLRELIASFRSEHRLSQRQFALRCGLSNGYISMIERGENPKTGQPITPTLQKLKQLADGMEMSLTELFASVDDMPVDLLKDTPPVSTNCNLSTGHTPSTTRSTPPISGRDIRAAFFNGYSDDLSEDEQDALWADAQAYMEFKLSQRKKKVED